MDNRSLERECDIVKSNVDNVINSLISEIDELERQVYDLKNIIESLEDKIKEYENI